MQTDYRPEQVETISEVESLARPGWGSTAGAACLLVVVGACAGALAPLGPRGVLPGIQALGMALTGALLAYGLKRALRLSGGTVPRFGAVLGALGGLALSLATSRAFVLAGWGALAGAGAGIVLLVRRAYLEETDCSILELAREAFALHEAGEVDPAERTLLRALTQSRKRLGPKHETTAALEHSMGNLLRIKRQYAASENFYKSAVQGYQARLGSRHPSLPSCLQDICQLYIAWEKVDEGVHVAEQALKLQGVDTLAAARTFTLLASLMMFTGRYDEAIARCRQALGLQRKLPSRHPDLLLTLSTLSDCLVLKESYLESEQSLRELIEGLESAEPPQPQQLLKAYLSLGKVLAAQDKVGESEPIYGAALELLQRQVGPVENVLDTVLAEYARLVSVPGPKRIEPERMELILAMRRGERAALGTAAHGDPALLTYRDPGGWGLVHWGTFFGNEDMVRALLESGAVWKGPDPDGSAMHIAVRWNRLKVLEEMLKAGVAHDEPDQTGATPLLLAATLGRLSVAEALIQAQADPNRPDRSGRLALLEAVKGRRLNMVAGLIAAGAQVNAQGPDGRTPLHLATELGLAEMVECLLLNGGRADQPDASGETVLALARRRRHRGVLQTLRRHAALA